MSIAGKIRKALKHRAALPLLRRNWAISTSIYAEDLLVDRILRPGPQGTYVDVGANHPLEGSNTYRLSLRGWSGLAIDPNPRFAGDFKRLRPRDTHLVMGVSQRPGRLTYFEFDHDHLNTLSPERAADLIAEGREVREKRIVETAPLSAIVEEHLGDKPIDLLNVDVEGMDLEVLTSLDLVRHRPSVMIVEDYGNYLNFLNGDSKGPFRSFLHDNGYRAIAQSAWSCILVGIDWEELFARSAAYSADRLQSSYMPGQFASLPWAASIT